MTKSVLSASDRSAPPSPIVSFEWENTMRMRFVLPFLLALTTPCYADDKAIANIADGITSYRLTASFCHWPIPSGISRVLDRDEIHFTGLNPKLFNAGVKSATDRFHYLTNSLTGYCHEIKSSRDEMTRSLEKRAE
jgi:hypothetical protein